MPYDSNGQAYEPDEPHVVIKAACAVIACVLVIVFAGCIAQQPEPEPTYNLYLDCSNSAVMHEHGLPTKADVMQWHVSGTWGYYIDGQHFTFRELPGDSKTWDDLYQIEPNSAFARGSYAGQ